MTAVENQRYQGEESPITGVCPLPRIRRLDKAALEEKNFQAVRSFNLEIPGPVNGRNRGPGAKN
jgi:hypothetical protein